MNKIKIPHLSPKAFAQTAKELMNHLRPSTNKIGAPPGTLIYTGKHHIPTKITLHQFNKTELKTIEIDTIEALSKKTSSFHINWVDIVGFENIEIIKELGEKFEIDPMTLEDMLNVEQLPKIEEHENYVYITLKIIDLERENNKINLSHFSIINKENLLISFAETEHELFNEISERLVNPLSSVRTSSINFLSYRLIDTIVDYYYFSLEWFSDILADLEIELVESPNKKHINTILTYKKQWLVLRKAIYPLKDVIRKGTTTDDAFVKSTGKQYIADLHDHLQSIFETMEILRETLSSLMDLYNSTVNNKMNEVMKVLTIVSTIFIPITFIAGIYGMNFENMPELAWENGYYYTVIVMLIIGISMAIYMKMKRWF